MSCASKASACLLRPYALDRAGSRFVPAFRPTSKATPVGTQSFTIRPTSPGSGTLELCFVLSAVAFALQRAQSEIFVHTSAEKDTSFRRSQFFFVSKYKYPVELFGVIPGIDSAKTCLCFLSALTVFHEGTKAACICVASFRWPALCPRKLLIFFEHGSVKLHSNDRMSSRATAASHVPHDRSKRRMRMQSRRSSRFMFLCKARWVPSQ